MTPDPHAERMQELVRFTASSLDSDHPSPFGCAIYQEASGALVAQAYDTVLKRGDPTNHEEMNAIREAARQRRSLSLRGCILYSTCEPCPMCTSASLWAEVDAIVYGASTLEDADPYWPQATYLSPEEIVSRMRLERRCRLMPHVERRLCQELFARCEAARKRRGLPLPPRR